MINVMTSSEQGTKAQLVKMVIGLNGWFRIPDYLKDTDEILRLCHYRVNPVSAKYSHSHKRGFAFYTINRKHGHKSGCKSK